MAGEIAWIAGYSSSSSPNNMKLPMRRGGRLTVTFNIMYKIQAQSGCIKPWCSQNCWHNNFVMFQKKHFHGTQAVRRNKQQKLLALEDKFYSDDSHIYHKLFNLPFLYSSSLQRSVRQDFPTIYQ